MKLPAPFFLIGLSAIVLVSCQKTHLETYEKPITSLLYILTPDSGNRVIFHYLDNDGEGGLQAIISGGTLMAETSYDCQLLINNNTARLDHFSDSTSVAQKPTLHQVFFLPMNGLDLETTYNDSDENGYPIGFSTKLRTGAPSQGTLRLTIIHAPDKSAPNVSQGDLTNANGQIDLQVDFEVLVSE